MKLKTLLWCFVCIVFSTLQAQDLLITELTDPQNSNDVGRYVEIYNPSTNDVDLSIGYALQRWTNGNTDPQSAVALTGTILAGGYYVVCNDAAKFLATYGVEASQDIGTGGAADSNGDDNVALIGPDGSVVDMFGVPGEDGSGTGHEFEDGRAEENVEHLGLRLGLRQIGMLIMIVVAVMEISMLLKVLILFLGLMTELLVQEMLLLTTLVQEFLVRMDLNV